MGANVAKTGTTNNITDILNSLFITDILILGIVLSAGQNF